MDAPAGKRMAPFLAEIVTRLRACGELDISDEVAKGLGEMSAATIDRRLVGERKRLELKGRSGTKPGTLLKSQIPIRTWADWDENRPGFVEIDCVGHEGGDPSGDFCQTLTVTDIKSGWTETEAVKNKAQKWVFAALVDITEAFPFPIIGVDSDYADPQDYADLGSWTPVVEGFPDCKVGIITGRRGRPEWSRVPGSGQVWWLGVRRARWRQRRIFTVPGRLVHSGRRRHLRLPASWPWARAIEHALANIEAIPLRLLTNTPRPDDQDPRRSRQTGSSRTPRPSTGQPDPRTSPQRRPRPANRWIRAYVLAVPVNERVIATVPGKGGGKVAEWRADALAARLPAQAWKKISAGAGSKGPREYHWARAAIRPLEDAESYWLLVRRNLTDPTDLAYYLCHGPERTPLRELVRIAGARWAIEETFQTAKGQVGLDQYQVRRYDSWYRHITLVMLAHAFLTVTTAQTNAEAGAKVVGRLPGEVHV